MTVVSFLELADLPDALRRLFRDRGATPPSRAVGVGWTPALDVVETEALITVSMDLAGVNADSVRLLSQGDTLLIAGEKASADRESLAGARFHLAEREFGRFARALRLRAAVDGSRIRAILEGGVLHVHLPKIVERRGVERSIDIEVVG